MVKAFNYKNNILRTLLNICRMKTPKMSRQTLKALQFSVTASDTLLLYLDVKEDQLYSFHEDRFERTKYNSENMFTLIHESDKATVKKMLSSPLWGTLTNCHSELRLYNKQNMRFEYYDCSCKSVLGKDLTPQKLFFSLKNINKEQECRTAIEDCNRQLQIVTQAADVLVWNYDTEKWIFTLFTNEDAGHKLFKLSELSNYVHKDDRQTLMSVIDIIQSKRDRSFNVEMRMNIDKLKNEWRYCSMNGIPCKYDGKGNVTTYSGYLKDITDLYKLKHKLKKANEKAFQVENLRNAFVANVSHNIRTPLNAIIGFTQLLESCNTAEERAQFIEIILDNNNKLLHYIDNLIEISSIQSGYFKIENSEVNICEIINDIYTRYCTRMNLGVTLHKNTPFQNFSVAFDRHWMDKITALTVESAIEIAESGSITLGFNGTTEGVEIYCHVEGVCNNTQINQSITDYENSRDINYRSDSAIGIGICKAIADKVNGSFTVENPSNETTEFIINIPCRILDVSAN